MITFNNIVTAFQNFTTNHFFLKTFSFGNSEDMDLPKYNEYPLLHLNYTGADYDEGTKTYNFEIFVLDLPSDKLDKVSYQREVISDAEQCVEDLLADVLNGGNVFHFADQYEVTSASVTPLEEETKNVLAGVLLTLAIEVPYQYDSCDAPLEGVTPTPPSPYNPPSSRCGCTAEEVTGDVKLDNVIGKYYPNDLTGNIIINDDSAVLGGVAVLGHNDSSEPTYVTDLSYYKHGNYIADSFNRVVISCTKSNLLDIFISQPVFVAGDIPPTLESAIFDSIELDHLILTFSENVTFSNVVGLTLNNGTTVDSIVSGNGTSVVTFLCSANLNSPEHTITIADTNTGLDGNGNNVTPTSAVVGGTAFESRFTFRDETSKIELLNPGGIRLNVFASGSGWGNHAVATRAFNGDNEVSYSIPTLVSGYSGTSIGLKSGTTYTGGFSSIDLWVDCFMSGSSRNMLIMENGSTAQLISNAWNSDDVISIDVVSGVPSVKVNGVQINTVTLSNLTGLLTPVCLINDACVEGNDIISDAKFRDSNGVETSPIT